MGDESLRSGVNVDVLRQQKGQKRNTGILPHSTSAQGQDDSVKQTNSKMLLGEVGLVAG
jgi:hypothetical protein